jgi:hypothetical protein
MRLIAVLLLLVALMSPVLAADPESEVEPARETWQADIASARARAAGQRAAVKADFERRKSERMLHPPSTEDLERERARWASEHVRGDLSLQKGDIVSTVDGFFVFVGDPNGERSPTDFVPLPK